MRWCVIDFRIQLIPFLQDGNFTTNGKIQITFHCVQSTNVIMFNANNLTILPSTVKLKLTNVLLPIHTGFIIKNQVIIIFIIVVVAIVIILSIIILCCCCSYDRVKSYSSCPGIWTSCIITVYGRRIFCIFVRVEPELELEQNYILLKLYWCWHKKL